MHKKFLSAIVAASFVIGGIAFFGGGKSVQSSFRALANEVEKPYQGLPKKYRDRVHVVMIRSEFEYGGEQHVFEAPVECGYKDGGRQLFQSERDFVLMNNRQFFTKLMDDGSIVLMHTPHLCGAWHHTWSDIAPNEWETYVPNNILPVYAWIPQPAGSTVFEEYVSESYHERVDARVRHVSFAAELGPYPVPDELILEARSSTKAQPIIKNYVENEGERFRWRKVYAKPFYKDHWRSVPALREIVESLPGDRDLVMLDRFPESWDGNENDFFKLDTHYLRTSGIPRRSEETGVIGETRSRSELLAAEYNTRALFTADTVVPMFCEGDLCRIDSTQNGYTRIQHASTLTYRKNGRFILEIDGERVELPRGPSGKALLIFDRRSQTVYRLFNA